MKTFLLLLISFLSFSLFSQDNRPNILILFADDQRADALGAYDNTYIKTPNLDDLAKNGTLFRNSYVMGGHHGAICAPSRAMLLTGKNLFHVYDKLAGVETWPMYFAKFGYQTFATGKWHSEQTAFEDSFQNADNVFLGGMSDHFAVPVRKMINGKLTEPEIKSYSTDLFANSAIQFIEEYGQSEKKNPFFCYVAFTAPHDPRSPREDYIGYYPDRTIPVPGNFKEIHPFIFDDFMVRDEMLSPWPRTPEIIQQNLSDYYGLVSHLDHRVGEIIQTLKNNGIYENTIIIYAADNGLAIGSHGLLGKQNLYEHSIKVPLIITGPGIPKNQKKDALVYLYDLFPTISEMVDIPIKQDVDGKSLLEVLAGHQEDIRESIYHVYRNTVRSVRTKEWKLIRYPERNYEQLFHLSKDPLEINNLIGKIEFQTRYQELKGLMKKWHDESDDPHELYPNKILPMEYDYRKLKQIPDHHQPKYTLDKYFNTVLED